MKTLCIVPCGNKKIWDKNPDLGQQKAKDVYIGTFAKKNQEYAEKFYPTSWVILSAKHGFLFPDDIIPNNYNVTFNNKRTNPISIEDLIKQAEEKGLYKFECIVVLGGKNYIKIVNEVFKGKHIQTPLSDCKGIGYMIEKLNNAIKENKPLSECE